MMRALLKNTVLANLVFVLVLALGVMSYQLLPRQQDPNINFNWVIVITALPGAAAEDVEQRVTQPLEDVIRKVRDVKYVASSSRLGLSNILVRFNDLDERGFDKRVSDLRREVQNQRDFLPSEIVEPMILEITSANAFPSAMVVLQGQANDETLRVNGYLLKRDLERIKGVDRVDTIGLSDPELQVELIPSALAALSLTPSQVADFIALQWRDLAPGKVKMGHQEWQIRHLGQSADAEDLAQMPLTVGQNTIPLAEVARVRTTRADASNLAVFNGKNAVVFAVMKTDKTNTLQLVKRLEDYLASFNQQQLHSGVTAILADDQTLPTKNAIGLMETNALQGLLLVLLVTWLFMGWRIGLLVAMAIPFSLAGVFIVLYVSGDTLNLTVLLGVVIALGMLVDVAVVMVEAMAYRLHQGQATLDAALGAMQEVGWPVVAAVLTTIAAFLPLMLLPGVLGDFMRVVPLVVTVALLISLIQAFWMLPSQTHAMHIQIPTSHYLNSLRSRLLLRLQNTYGRFLAASFRHPLLTIILLLAAFASAIWLMTSGRITTNFFANDPLRVFYVNVEMPQGTPMEVTLEKVLQVEQQTGKWLRPSEVRALVSYAGQMFTETEPRRGDNYGQIFVSLAPPSDDQRSVDDMIDGLRQALQQSAPVSAKITLLKLADGPPSSKPISVKVRGDDYGQIGQAVTALKQEMAKIPGIKDITDDTALGAKQLVTRLRVDAIADVGLDVMSVLRTLRLLADGEVVTQVSQNGELIDLRVRGPFAKTTDLQNWLDTPLATPKAGLVPLSALVEVQQAEGYLSLRHQNYSRAITLEADLDKTQTDTLVANQMLQDAWKTMSAQHPGISLDFTGELDEIQESLGAMGMLFVLGLGLMYLILGAQFNSYLQPMIILFTIPMAFTGVAYGLWLSGNPLSLYTLYGVVALSGIAVNSAIVLMAAANERLQQGMGVLHATLYAARRRLVPILITATTTMAGLMGLALGIGGHSLIFGPVATAIVWGISVSTLLTLFTIPLIFRLLVRQPKGMDKSQTTEVQAT